MAFVRWRDFLPSRPILDWFSVCCLLSATSFGLKTRASQRRTSNNLCSGDTFSFGYFVASFFLCFLSFYFRPRRCLNWLDNHTSWLCLYLYTLARVTPLFGYGLLLFQQFQFLNFTSRQLNDSETRSRLLKKKLKSMKTTSKHDDLESYF